MTDVVVLTACNGVGLSRTGRILADALASAGLWVAVRDHADPPEPARLAVVHVEVVSPA